MMKVILSLLVGLGVAMSGVGSMAYAATKSSAHRTKKSTKIRKAAKKGSVKAPVAKKDKLSTDVKFGDNTLHGQYQTPDEALANVENEKGLSDLIGVRKHFKDRLATASEQE